MNQTRKEPPPLLQKWHRNGIFEAIRGVGLDPREFDLDNSATAVSIKHKWSESYFMIGGGPGQYVGHGVIGDGSETPYKVYTWDALSARVRLWAQLLKDDLDTPDLWAELQRETKLLGEGSNEITENTPFTSDEQKVLAARLRELEVSIRQACSLSESQIQALDKKIDYLIDASSRLGRKDWLNTFLGVILTFAVSVAIAPEAVRSIALIALRAIGLLYPELPFTT